MGEDGAAPVANRDGSGSVTAFDDVLKAVRAECEEKGYEWPPLHGSAVGAAHLVLGVAARLLEQERAETHRLRREVEFEAHAIDLSGRAPVGHGFVNGACQCECGEQFTTLGEWLKHCEKFAICACSIDFAALDPERWVRPQCAVHPEGQGEIRALPWTEEDAAAFEASMRPDGGE